MTEARVVIEDFRLEYDRRKDFTTMEGLLAQQQPGDHTSEGPHAGHTEVEVVRRNRRVCGQRQGVDPERFQKDRQFGRRRISQDQQFGREPGEQFPRDVPLPANAIDDRQLGQSRQMNRSNVNSHLWCMPARHEGERHQPKMKIHDEYEQCRLADIVNSNRVICFCADCPDKEVPRVRWSCFGSVDTGEVLVRAKNGSLEYFHGAPSALL